MFGKNPVLGRDKGDGSSLKIVKGSPFRTIQGECYLSGMPAIFIRLHGCPWKCFFCDTAFSDPDDPVMTVEKIVAAVEALPMTHLIVITGGEPMRQPLIPLCKALWKLGHQIQLETAGTYWQDGLELYAEFVVSPKTSYVHPAFSTWARAFKYVVDSEMSWSEDGIPITATQPGTKPARLGAPTSSKIPIWVSPCDDYDPAKNAANLKAATDASLKYGHRVSLQIHKLLGVE